MENTNEKPRDLLREFADKYQEFFNFMSQEHDLILKIKIMKKQDKIIEAYGKHWEAVKDFVDENGCCCAIDYSVPGVETKNHPSLNEMGIFQKDNFADTWYDSKEYKYFWRPKSLEGIDENNGWNLMEDFDGNDEDYFLFLRYHEGEGEPPIFTSVLSDDFQIGYFTHWRKIDISQPPIY